MIQPGKPEQRCRCGVCKWQALHPVLGREYSRQVQAPVADALARVHAEAMGGLADVLGSLLGVEAVAVPLPSKAEAIREMDRASALYLERT